MTTPYTGQHTLTVDLDSRGKVAHIHPTVRRHADPLIDPTHDESTRPGRHCAAVHATPRAGRQRPVDGRCSLRLVVTVRGGRCATAIDRFPDHAGCPSCPPLDAC